MFVFIVFAVPVLTLTPHARADLKEYDTKYYTIYTDIEPDQEREAAIRMTKMAEEYHERTKGFSGTIKAKFPFYLFKSADDYYAAGGMPKSAGVFMSLGSGGKLMAIAHPDRPQETWHVVQHEGFHQFAHAVIGGTIPTWLNEGLAEYFGESVFTGDGFVTGVIPPWRLERLKGEISDGETKTIPQIMALSSDEWAGDLNIKNYDQAWSMVHFLVHGDDQKYQAAFGNCLSQISTGKSFNTAWLGTIGPTNGFEGRWKDWWSNQPKNPSTVLYGKAAVATMTSFIARAYTSKQTFADFSVFQAAVEDGSLKINPDDWLPRTLILSAFKNYGNAPHWELATGQNKQPTVELTLVDGTRITGSFSLRGARVEQVVVEVDEMVRILKDAQALLDAGKKSDAKMMVVAGLKNIPKTALIAEAKKFLQACR